MNKKPAWYELRWPVGLGLLAVVVLIGGLLLALLSPGAIKATDLPVAVKPVDLTKITPTPAATVSPTATPELTATPVVRSKPTPTPLNARLPGEPGEPGIARRPVGSTAGGSPALLPTPTPLPPLPTPTPLPPLPGIEPVRLRVPSLGINAFVEYVGLDKERRMDVPQSIWNVGWYKLGVKPGERGNAVFAGHVDGPNTPAVFWELREAKVNTKIYVQDSKGEEKLFEVFDVATYDYDKAPLDRIFGSSNDAQLVLITCTGTFDQAVANYDKRFVAYARLVNR